DREPDGRQRNLDENQTAMREAMALLCGGRKWPLSPTALGCMLRGHAGRYADTPSGSARLCLQIEIDSHRKTNRYRVVEVPLQSHSQGRGGCGGLRGSFSSTGQTQHHESELFSPDGINKAPQPPATPAGEVFENSDGPESASPECTSTQESLVYVEG